MLGQGALSLHALWLLHVIRAAWLIFLCMFTHSLTHSLTHSSLLLHAAVVRWLACVFRCGRGIESPELAQEWLTNGCYHPTPGQDVWAFGLLLLRAMGGTRPRDHMMAIAHHTTVAYAASLVLASPTYVEQVSCAAMLVWLLPAAVCSSLNCWHNACTIYCMIMSRHENTLG